MAAVFPPVVRPCIEEAVRRAGHLVGIAVEAAAAALLEDTRKSVPAPVRQEISDAAADLLGLRAAWAAAFPQALRTAMEAPAAGAASSRPGPSSLTLLDDSEVLQSIEASRLAQQLEGRVEKVLGELDRYMSSALGLAAIQPEANPLRPAVFAQALRSVMNEPAPEAGRPGLWMRHMAEPVAAELQLLYERCVGLLSQARVQAAQYRVVATPDGGRSSRAAALDGADSTGGWSGSASGAWAPAAPAASTSGWMGLAAQHFGGRVLRDFLFGPAPAAPQPLAPAFYQQAGQELAALEAQPDEPPADPLDWQDLRQLPVVERPAREVGCATALSPGLWGDYGAPRQRSLVRARLKQQAQSADQVMGLDLVRQLLEQVARDPRLLAPVREAMVALEPSLARLAMQAPRFFARHDNPARRLLEGVAQRSFQYNDEFSTEFQAFFGPVKDSFNTLNQLESLDDDAPFEEALAGLQSAWAAQDREAEAQRQHTLEAIRQVEQRQAEADRVARELSQRSDLDGVPAVVQDFVLGPWALVIAHARQQRPGEVDPGGYARIVADLLWSVKPETLRDPARAFEVLPRVLLTLRKGLQGLGQPASETEAFFRALERLHWPIMKLRMRQRRGPAIAEPPAVAPEVLAPAPARQPEARAELFLGQHEQQAVGFEDTTPSMLEDSAAAPLEAIPAAPAAPFAGLAQPLAPMPSVAAATRTAGAPAAAPAQAQAQAQAQAGATVPPVQPAAPALPLDGAAAEAVVAGLHEGAWVDLYSRQQWHRARLTWAAARGTLFMFVSHGNRPHSMTRRTLQRLVMDRLLRPVDGHEVVQQALDLLARSGPDPSPDRLGAVPA